jgi:hypothetical protein
MDSREITLNCPLCTADHVYPLEVERSMAIGMLVPGRAMAVPIRRRSFVRLFACPVKSNQFEATLTLRETAEHRIVQITVGAPRVDG